MRISEFDFHLPKQAIAQEPVKPRDHSRLMFLKRRNNAIDHFYFYHLPTLLRPGDVLVLNNTKVFPARLIGTKESGGKIEVFLLKAMAGKSWQVMLGGRRKTVGMEIYFSPRLSGRIMKHLSDTTWEVRFTLTKTQLMAELEKIGHVPVPPYIKKPASKRNYQTLFAERVGSVAAPTAGFHFTAKTFRDLEKRGVKIEYVTLHVGLGTFAPVKTERIEDHHIHSEWAEISEPVVRRLRRAKKAGQRIIPVGTTSLRTLEAFTQKNGVLRAGKKWVDIFIYPGYRFRMADALITNFHTPRSTLLMLVSAFAGTEFISRAYYAALEHHYRFY